MILINALIPAILAGNSVILKPSPQTPTIVEQVAKIFTEAGLPDGVLQYFHCGSPTVMETIVRDPKIALVCFTGSVAGGLAVQKAAADRIVNVGLELGGKDPAYIRDDVDIDWAAEEIVDGAIFNSGQSCCSLERIYVDEKVHDAFVAAVQKVLKGYKLGDPFDKSTHVGPVISKRSKETIESHIQDALKKGAKDVTPENESFENPPPKGNFVKPTLLIDVDHTMTVMTEETFGPVIPVMKVKGDDEAVKLMNDSEFGLTASIWTKDVDRGYALSEEVEAGTVFVNRCDFPSPVSLVYACTLPPFLPCWPVVASHPTGQQRQQPGNQENTCMMCGPFTDCATHKNRTSHGQDGRTRAEARRWAGLALTHLSSPRASTSRTIRNKASAGALRYMSILKYGIKERKKDEYYYY